MDGEFEFVEGFDFYTSCVDDQPELTIEDVQAATDLANVVVGLCERSGPWFLN